MWHMGDGWGWWMAFGWAWMIGFWILVIWAVSAFIGRGSSDAGVRRDSQFPDALETLNRRYANGEISEDEYERMRSRILTSSETTHSSSRGIDSA
jgi:putative membrane protein